MKIVDEVAAVQRRVISQAAVVSSTLAGLAMLSGRWPEAWGVLSGTLVAIINFCLLARNIRGLIGADPRAAKVRGGFYYIGRYFLAAAILIYSFTSPLLNMYAVLVGLMLVKAVILGKAIITYFTEWVVAKMQSAYKGRGDK